MNSEKLIGRLDQQTGLRLDEQQHAFLLGMLGDRLDHLDEQFERRGPGCPWLDRTARFGGDAGRP